MKQETQGTLERENVSWEGTQAHVSMFLARRARNLGDLFIFNVFSYVVRKYLVHLYLSLRIISIYLCVDFVGFDS